MHNINGRRIGSETIIVTNNNTGAKNLHLGLTTVVKPILYDTGASVYINVTFLIVIH